MDCLTPLPPSPPPSSSNEHKLVPSSATRNLKYVVGNLYNCLPDNDALFDRTRTHRKIQDWTVFVDVSNKVDAELIDTIRFDPDHPSFGGRRIFTCYCPVLYGGKWRFQSRQQTYGRRCPVKITIRLRNGKVRRFEYEIDFRSGGGRRAAQTIEVDESAVVGTSFSSPKMPETEFRVEIDMVLSSFAENSVEDLVGHVQKKSSTKIVVVEPPLCSDGEEESWMVVVDHDDGVTDDMHVTLYTPTLKGGTGMNKLSHVIKIGIGSFSSIRAREGTSGLRVRIIEKNLPLSSTIKVCQNFVKYEDAMDVFLSPSCWRDASNDETVASVNGVEKEVCLSNKTALSSADDGGAVCHNRTTNKYRHDRIGACGTFDNLCAAVNPNERSLYKLCLNEHSESGATTFGFRQHPSTTSFDAVRHWIRFCAAFVHNSARLQAPRNSKDSTDSVRDQFNKLFPYVIKDRSSRDYYEKRLQLWESSDNAMMTIDRNDAQEYRSKSVASSGACSSGGETKRQRIS